MKNIKRKLYCCALIFCVSCTFNYDQSQKEQFLVREIMSNIPRDSRIAIGNFVDSGTQNIHEFNNDLVAYLVDEFTNFSIYNEMGVTVLERQLVDQALSELAFQNSDLSDRNNVKRIGKFISADYIILGSIHEMENRNFYLVIARCIDIETLEIISTAREIIFRDFDVVYLKYGALYNKSGMIMDKVYNFHRSPNNKFVFTWGDYSWPDFGIMNQNGEKKILYVVKAQDQNKNGGIRNILWLESNVFIAEIISDYSSVKIMNEVIEPGFYEFYIDDNNCIKRIKKHKIEKIY
ncbi:MAG: hypothetical protein JW870_11275 [Candidatus Delongbacteria bacterium]|nr:hypothetical protein [Candidatus Delongbacteria bacterium]